MYCMCNHPDMVHKDSFSSIYSLYGTVLQYNYDLSKINVIDLVGRFGFLGETLILAKANADSA